MNAILITSVGLLAQCFFSARTLVQWILSEKARKVLSPTAFWVCSVIGSALLATYGWLRMDFAIVAGQMINYYIYLWNLKAKGVKMAIPFWLALMLFPVIALCCVTSDWDSFVATFLHNADIPQWLLIFGTVGQFVLSIRFIYQWIYSSRRGESMLPPVFWWISLTGATIVFTYGIIRFDIVLMLGQGFGLLVYARNLMIGYRQKKTEPAS